MDITRETPVAGAPNQMERSTWSWGQRARTRIAELQALCQLMAMRPNAAPDASVLAMDARALLERASRAVDRKRAPWGRLGAAVDTAETSMNAAACLLLRYMPLEDLEGGLPDLVATVQEHLLPQDPRRREVEELLRRTRAGQHLSVEARETVATAVRAALAAKEREYIRVRSFRNIVYGVACCLALLAFVVAHTTYRHPTLNPMCFQPGEQVVSPTGSAPLGAGQSLDAACDALASRWDYVVIEMVGLVAAAVAAAAAMRQLRGTSVPYDVPFALALLKLPTGSLTAVLGLLLMRGQFVPGLSALDSSAQILAWAVVFGYAQQLLTRTVDARGQAVLNAVGGPKNPAAPAPPPGSAPCD